MSKSKLLENFIWWLPVSPINKFKFRRSASIVYNTITGKRKLNESVPLIISNGAYGHEYWLKTYSHWEKPIYGIIEHGVYWGNYTGICGDARDYVLKNIITFGDYREKYIKIGFPDYHVTKVGPRIAYAKTDTNLLKKLMNEVNGESVLTLFPAHSLNNFKCEYDIEYLIIEAKKIMKESNIKHLRVCLKEVDMINGTAKDFVDKGCSVVTAGSESIDFLPRLRAIIEASALTMSNSLGTHLGYCIYLKKPHILIKQDRNHTGTGKDFIKECEVYNSIKEKYQEEENLFLKHFSYDNTMHITDAQYELCDYYWGFNHVKDPSSLYKELENVYVNSL